MQIDLYTQTGEKSGKLELPKNIFEVEWNGDLVHQALLRQLSNGRAAVAHTKGRGEVQGGGRKPWKQKGTGRARHGSIRSPLWRGGAVLFGPRNTRNFEKDMPVMQRRKALFCALSEKARKNAIIGLENYETKEAKTKTFAEMLGKLPVGKDVLVVLPGKNQLIEKSSRNIPYVKTILANYLNIHDLQKHETVLILKEAVETIKKTFTTKSK